MTQDLDPRELIKQRYYPLEGAIAPLAELIRINPQLIEEIISLAMVMGIHTGQQRVQADRRAEVFGLVKEDLHRATRQIWDREDLTR